MRTPVLRSGSRPHTLLALLALLPVALLAACGDGESGGPAEPPTVTDVSVDPTAADLTIGEEVVLDVTVTYSDGTSTSPSSVGYAVADPSVASVSPGGVVTGLAEGSTRVDATVEGRTASVQVSVAARASEATVVVDSTETEMVSTSEQKADGELRFLGAAATSIGVGDVVVGDQSGGFLRRVTAVETRGDTVVATTAFASLDEVVEGGSFRSVVDLDLAQPAPVTANGVRWSAPEVAWTAPGVHAGPGGISFAGTVLVQREVCGEKDGQQVCGTFTVDLPTGLVEFTPEVDLGVEFGWGRGLREFHAIGSGTLVFDVDVRATAAVAAQLTGERTLATVKRFFWGTIGVVPVVGEIRMDIVGAFTADMKVEGSVTTGATATAGMTAGARYENGSWSHVFEPATGFETRPLDWDADVEASVRFDVKPVFTMILYEVAGPTAAAIPYVKFAGAADLDACSYEGSVSAGVDLSVGFKVEVLGQDVDEYSTTVEGTPSVLLHVDGNLVEELHSVGGDGQTGEPGQALQVPIEILVTDEDVEAAAGIEVVFEVDEGSGSVSEESVVTNASGHASTVWTLGPEPGNHRVTARTPDCGGANEVVFTAEAVEDSGGPTGQVIGSVGLAEPTAITALAGASVTAETAAAAGARKDRGPQAVETVTTDADGLFHFTALPPGGYTVLVSHASVVDTRVFQVDVTENGVVVLDPVVVVRPSSVPGTLSGDVLRRPSDDFPVPGATLELRPGVNAPDIGPVVASGSSGGVGPDQGEFTIAGVPAGTYTVKVVAPGGGVNRATWFVIGGQEVSVTIYVHPDGE